MAELMHFQPGKTFYDAFQGARGNTLAKLAITGEGEQRKSALADLYGLDPSLASQAQAQIGKNDEQDYSELVQSAKVMYSLKGRPEADMMWQRVAPKFSQKYGIQFNPTPQPSDWDAIEKIVQATDAGGKPKARSSHILADGTIAFMDEYGNLTKTGEKASNTYGFQTDAEGNVYAQDRRQGNLKPAGMGGANTQEQPPKDYRQTAIELQGMLRDAGIDPEAAREIATMYHDKKASAPKGQYTDGVIADVPAGTVLPQTVSGGQARVAVKPKEEKIETWGQPTSVVKNGKPVMIQISNLGNERERPDLAPAPSDGKLTDDMRKTSTLLSRMDFALNQIRDVEKSDKSANRPGYGVAAIDYLPDALGNDLKSSGRQQIESAQLDALDAALTLATGAAYTKEQLFGLRKAYFPQPNDSEATIKAKQARFENVIQSARVRAGNAAQAPIKPAGGAKGAPQVGDVVKGYRYLGGNPADPKSWKKQ